MKKVISLMIAVAVAIVALHGDPAHAGKKAKAKRNAYNACKGDTTNRGTCYENTYGAANAERKSKQKWRTKGRRLAEADARDDYRRAECKRRNGTINSAGMCATTAVTTVNPTGQFHIQ